MENEKCFYFVVFMRLMLGQQAYDIGPMVPFHIWPNCKKYELHGNYNNNVRIILTSWGIPLGFS